MNKPTELYACIYVREFPAQALLRLRPELHDKPSVVLEGEAPAQAICALNTRARLMGLRHGMTKVEVDTFEGITVLERSLRTEDAVRRIFLECAGIYIGDDAICGESLGAVGRDSVTVVELPEFSRLKLMERCSFPSMRTVSRSGSILVMVPMSRFEIPRSL
jgi:hypothetical protein